MVVDEAGGLHEGVADGGADELEAAAFEVAAHGARGLGFGRESSIDRKAFRHGRPSTNDQTSASSEPSSSMTRRVARALPTVA